jgi:PleD family two-component response regulator
MQSGGWEMTRKNDYDITGFPDFSGMGSGLKFPRMVSVLLIFNNPVDLDRICRQLEKNGNIMADISVSDEDAFHLMHYVPFDVIVTEYRAREPEQLSFLKTMRSRSMDMPVIYYSRSRDAATEDEALQYGSVYFVSRIAAIPAPEPDDLYPVIIRVVSMNTIQAP